MQRTSYLDIQTKQNAIIDQGQPKAKSPWISAWSDNVAGIDTFSQLMTLADLQDDGDYKLVVSDQKGKLKIYMGTNVIYNQKLEFDKPTAIQTFYDSNKKPMFPIVAIASGSALYYYKNFQPLMKFEFPIISFSKEEQEIWIMLPKAGNELEIQPLTDRLFALREGGFVLSSISSELLSLESISEQIEYSK